MCGFLGKVQNSFFDYDELISSNKNIICRGPDECIHLKGESSLDFKTKNKTHYSFVFNRLSILDLTNKASQPMYSSYFNTLIMFNGEIYNHKALRSDLEEKGVVFQSNHSDTEVILNGLSFHGIDYVKQLIGQFSIVFYDLNNQSIFLIRDRLGQKPLFFHHSSDKLIFSSSLKSISQNENLREVSDKGLIDYLDYGVVPSPNTIFKEIFKVKPAEIIEFKVEERIIQKNKFKYWDILNYEGTQKFKEEKFFDILDSAVQLRELADVDVAVFSSGGIDSTSIIKNMHDRGSQINSYSVGYKNNKYDESFWFNQVNNEYKTNSTVEFLESFEADQIINESIDIFDEPYSDPSTVPSYLISKKISEDYKVAISGDGGDELFGAYGRIYQTYYKKFRLTNTNVLNKLYPNFLGTGGNIMKYDKQIKKAYSSFLSDKSFLSLLNLNSNYTLENNFFVETENKFKSLMISDYKFYLSEMMMLKVDSTSMASSLEVRSPFVDHRLVEYVLSTSTEHIDSNIPKKLLKTYLREDFNDDFLYRKKMGFVFDIENWVFANLEMVLKEISYLDELLKVSKINRLKLYKSRINSHRLWRLYFLSKYLMSN